MYQRVGKRAYKGDLSNTITLAKHLGNPQEGFRSIHVGGTNGKGSTSHMLASVLMESGYKVGLYTSPHLKDFRERIRINRQMIAKPYVTEFIHNNRSFFEAHGLSFFEMTVGLAFSYFRDQRVDIAVIEVGLGGRLDSTNIITPLASVITNIGYDHMQFLGNTLEKIATEKAGIIKSGVPVVIGETLPETKPIFQAKARAMDAEILFAEELQTLGHTHSDLKGWYQHKNIRTALTTCNLLSKQLQGITEETISRGLTSVVENTGLMGRWQILGSTPLIVADTAHNKEGLQAVLHQLKSQNYRRLYLVLGFVNDKTIKDLLALFPTEASYFFCAPQIARALAVEDLEKQANELGLKGTACRSVKEGLKYAKLAAGPEDLIFVGGSTFVVAEAL